MRSEANGFRALMEEALGGGLVPELPTSSMMAKPQAPLPDPNTPYGRIYATVRQIPYGQVATYGQIARLVGRCSARMVGYAMAGLSFDSDVPWHRVINHRGRISPRAGIGSELQRQRLEQEGVWFGPDGSIDLGKFRWDGTACGHADPVPPNIGE